MLIHIKHNDEQITESNKGIIMNWGRVGCILVLGIAFIV